MKNSLVDQDGRTQRERTQRKEEDKRLATSDLGYMREQVFATLATESGTSFVSHHGIHVRVRWERMGSADDSTNCAREESWLRLRFGQEK